MGDVAGVRVGFFGAASTGALALGALVAAARRIGPRAVLEGGVNGRRALLLFAVSLACWRGAAVEHNGLN